MDYTRRQARLQSQFSQNGIDVILVTHLPNIRYLCGFTGSAAALVVTNNRSVFFSDGRYIDQANAEVQGSRIVIGRQAPLVSAAEWLAEHRSKKNKPSILGIDGEHLTVSSSDRLAKELKKRFRLKQTPPLIEQARMIKDAAELGLIRAAVLMGSALFQTVLDSIRPGVSENNVAAALEYAARKAGAQRMSFETIIASGKRSALPHGVASSAKVPSKGFVVCDFGVILSGYCSDMTRTVHVGTPTTEAKRVYAAVREAQQAAIEAVKPGVNVGEVDGVARKVLRKNGLGGFFTHSTGHGVGLEIHEAPRIGASQPEVLKAGMVITIEPGVYIPQKLGVRIEDMVRVTETGCEVLTPTSKELITL